MMPKQFKSVSATILPRRESGVTSVRSGQFMTFDDALNAIRQLPPAPFATVKREDFNPAEGIEIGMNCAGITDARSRTPILGTYGLATCLGVAVFNRQTLTGGLAHLAQAEDDPLRLSPGGGKSLINLLQAVRTDKSHPLEVRLTAGPTYDGFPFMADILQILNATPNLHILSSDTGEKRNVTAFGIDARHWGEGLLKGSNSSGIGLSNITTDQAVMERYSAGARNVLDMTALTPGRVGRNGLVDARDYDGTGGRPSPGKRLIM